MKFTGIFNLGKDLRFQIFEESSVLHLHQILDDGESVVNGGALVGVRVASNLSGAVSSGLPIISTSLSELVHFKVSTKNFIVFITCTIRPISTFTILRQDSNLRFP
ncbi:ubiquitin receptor RAD23d-like [Pyrus ussuriensis x Pyrus communis]|uniref:Ubiquitin receptor RAD23d-like n=1 Tax=Pyrus ussuriensis x Pyrus communis TaxID=2448454 RepID=A0A5N5GMT2_9ROSA|nr:ubiquitin receptor RAD23d-like [Pyrus ussuriensis x Pyrus communis]